MAGAAPTMESSPTALPPSGVAAAAPCAESGATWELWLRRGVGAKDGPKDGPPGAAPAREHAPSKEAAGVGGRGEASAGVSGQAAWW